MGGNERRVGKLEGVDDGRRWKLRALGGPRRHSGACGHVDSALRQLQLQLASFITCQLRYPLLFCISRWQLLELSTNYELN